MSHATPSHRRNSRPGATRPRRRRAVATLVVLLLISIALALSYSIMRAQSTAVAIQRNANLSLAARQAAMVGVTTGLKRMHVWDPNDSARSWGGVGSTLQRSLSTTERFEVRFATGDPSLVSDDPWLTSKTPTLIADHPDRGDFPYRVTLFVTGYAADRNDPTRVATHQIRAVVRLVPRKLADEPSGWGTILQHTVCQWTNGTYSVDVPFRIRGAQRIQGQLSLGSDYPWSADARRRYLRDLNAMAAVGAIDYRPFDGPLHLPYSQQTTELKTLLATSKAIPVADVPTQGLTPPSSPVQATDYQIYPGGKRYSPRRIAQNQQYVTLEPDPVANPLGMFLCEGEATLGDHVTIRGTLLTRGSSNGDVHVVGRNVRLLSYDLPSLAGQDVAVRLPVVVTQDDFRFHPEAQAIVTGMLALGDEFEVQSGLETGTAVLGTAVIAEAKPAPGSRSCEIRSAYLNRVNPQVVPENAKFCVGTPGNFTVYTVTKRFPADASPTVRIEFTPPWSSPAPAMGDEIRFVPFSHDMAVMVRGRVAAKHILIHGRSNWANDGGWWNIVYDLFLWQLGATSNPEPYFPRWVQHWGLEPWPQSSIAPEPADSAPTYYHWKNPYDPIYVPHPDDDGLRWELLEWTDNP